MLKGETVEVLTRTETGIDSMNNAAYEHTSMTVENVLISPGITSDIQESGRPVGTRTAFTLHFPKTYKDSLAGLDVIVRGTRCRVIGSPQRFNEANTPGPWNMQVEVEVVDG